MKLTRQSKFHIKEELLLYVLIAYYKLIFYLIFSVPKLSWSLKIKRISSIWNILLVVLCYSTLLKFNFTMQSKFIIKEELFLYVLIAYYKPFL